MIVLQLCFRTKDRLHKAQTGVHVVYFFSISNRMHPAFQVELCDPYNLRQPIIEEIIKVTHRRTISKLLKYRIRHVKTNLPEDVSF